MKLIDYAFKYSGKLKIYDLPVKMLSNQVTSLCCWMSFILRIVDSSRKSMMNSRKAKIRANLMFLMRSIEY